MAQARKPVTPDGKKRMERLLTRLIKEERPKVIQAVKEARAHGDLSENADYDAAKEQQSLLEGRIAALKEALARAQVVNPAHVKSDSIAFGAYVSLLQAGDPERRAGYYIVGEEEADIKAGRLSVNSPLAKKMIGLKAGDVFVLKTPKGEREYEILSFSFKWPAAAPL